MAYIKEYWTNRERRAEQAQNHTAEMQSAYSKEIKDSIKGTVIYDTYFVCEKESKSHMTKIIVEDLDSVSSIIKYSKDCNGKMAVLNFSSYKNPGGMFISGSGAQEECLCHDSFLYNVLREFVVEFYDWNNRHKTKALYLNRALYSPNIIFCKDGAHTPCSVITCASPNKSAAQKYQNVSDDENTKALKSRIRFVLDIAKDNNVNTLILGAYGCGVFGQDPVEVASIFREYLETSHKNCFEKVVFAIPEGRNNNLETFKGIFNQ